VAGEESSVLCVGGEKFEIKELSVRKGVSTRFRLTTAMMRKKWSRKWDYLVRNCILVSLKVIGRSASQNDRSSLEYSPLIPKTLLSLAATYIAAALCIVGSVPN
jgi:hypothetical protein